MGRKITMAANPWKVVALGSLHAHPPRGHRVPAHAGRCDRPLAGGAAQATPSRRTRGGSVHLVLSRRPGPSGERDSRAPVPVLPAPLGEVDPRGSGARPDETLAALPAHAGLLRARRYGGDLASVSPNALRRHPRTLAAAAGAVRMGGAAGPSRAPRDDVLRRGAAVGEGCPALPEGLSGVGRATLGPRGRHLQLYRRR